jgi:preprotein translocase subunit SecG
MLLIIHVIVCVFLILVVLLQSGKAADLAGAFGGGGSQTALGSRGAATFLTKATTISAALFMVTSLSLALLGSRRSGSVLESVPVAAAPVGKPAATPVPGTPSPEGAGGVQAPSPTPADTGKSPDGGSGKAGTSPATQESGAGKDAAAPVKPK